MQLNTLFFSFVSAALFSSAIAGKDDCYKIENFGLKENNCNDCRPGFKFVPSHIACEVKHQCCIGACCPHH
ncbi:hypothetical protein EYZ11_010157 [Aspergillus tanneri]|uniref:Uncharacterized protein n=1 Tax=Aspergillus tanneri TaxID=1220188 RepID=A0A4S3J609_9EURO|nr:hypothetical protein EYZ11_010157 [Aspergillus tanneri]